MVKLHYQQDQEELFARCGGHMTELINTETGVKAAASQAIGRDIIEQFRPDADHFLQHVIAMGDHESYGPNRNQDAWTKKANSENFQTFTKYGHFFKEHRHTNPSLKIGDIKYAAYNEPMARIELLVWGHKKKAEAQYQKALDGGELHYSMAARVPHDICNVCDHVAKSPALWCGHMKRARGQYIASAKKYAFVRNPDPKFFDISDVGYNADRIAHYLQYSFGDDEMLKAASADMIINGAEWAEFEGVTAPADMDDIKLSGVVSEWVNKMAALEVELATGCQDSTSEMREIVKAASWLFDLSGWTDGQAEALRIPNAGTLFHHLATKKAMMPLPLFAAYAQDIPLSTAMTDPKVAAAEDLMDGIFGRIITEGPIADVSTVCSAFGSPAAGHDPSFDDELDGLVAQAEEKFGLRCAVKRCSAGVLRASIEESKPGTVPGESVIKLSSQELAESYALYQAQALSDMARFGDPAGDVDLALLVGSNTAKK